jgi:hypothetical protein
MYNEQIEELKIAIARMENLDASGSCVDAMKAAVEALQDAEQVITIAEEALHDAEAATVAVLEMRVKA